MSVSAEQMVLYLEAADLVLDQVFGPSQKPNSISKTVNFTTTGRGFDDSERTLPDGVVLFSGAKFLPMYGVSLPGTGLYRVRVKVRAEQSETPVVMHVFGGNTGAIAAWRLLISDYGKGVCAPSPRAWHRTHPSETAVDAWV